jgi:DNA integrity scanning protein DisA with diadenylate cyclase activity
MTITGVTNPNMKTGNCEICDSVGVSIALHYGNIWFCDSCWTKEEKSTLENTSPSAVAARLDTIKDNSLNSIVKESNLIDSTIQVRTDLFNAATVAIMDLKKSIDADESITNKPYELAKTLKDRFEHYKQVVFELNEKVVEAGNQQKAIQIYLNNLANQLRADEREKLKISDISYSTKPIKASVKKISTSKKIDKIELRKFASELGISEFTLQMVVVQKGISVADAAFLLKKSIESASVKSVEIVK